MCPEDLAKLRQLAPPVQGAPEFLPSMPVMPETSARPAAVELAAVAVSSAKGHPSTSEALEAVVRVLIRKGILDRSELFDEIDKLKARRN
jgi:hypothetical protein